MQNNLYEIAKLGNPEESAIKKAEKLIKDETGKDLVIIAWEKNLSSSVNKHN
ncbi:hypothetical protein [Metaclostridioides mangenotii]|uniref:hypothetical protein n=1 Tax=Metaclostridioides mangenotii TaxID=1540 RepID=UPI0004ADCFA9|nr:hypothetical protein [Clostridioides mangenotii]